MPGRRTLNPLWIGFIRNDTNPRNVKAKCKKCGSVIQAVIERMKKHARTCKNVNLRIAQDKSDSRQSKKNGLLLSHAQRMTFVLCCIDEFFETCIFNR